MNALTKKPTRIEAVKAYIRDKTDLKTEAPTVIDTASIADRHYTTTRRVREAISELRKEGLYYFPMHNEKLGAGYYQHYREGIDDPNIVLDYVENTVKAWDTLYFNDLIPMLPLLRHIKGEKKAKRAEELARRIGQTRLDI